MKLVWVKSQSPRRRPRHLEDAMQVHLMEYLQFVFYGPRCIGQTIFHIPNGGKRNKFEAARLHAMGVKPGVSDLFLPIPIRNYHGAFFELKAEKNKETEAQRKFGLMVYSFGYYKATHWSWQSCAQDIIGYLRAGVYEVRAPEFSMPRNDKTIGGS